MKYGTGHLDGYYARDNFCFNKQQNGACFETYQLNFIGAYETSEQLKDLQGIIGLGPHQFGSSWLFDNQVGNNSLDTTFSVYYCLDEREQSKFIFGPPEVSKYALVGSTDADVHWANIATTEYFQDIQWLSQLSSASFGSGKIYNPQVHSVVFQADTGTTDLTLDVVSFKNLLNLALAKGIKCETTSNKTFCTCKEVDCSDFPTINTVVESGTGQTFNLSLESNFTMRNIGQDYKYYLMI